MQRKTTEKNIPDKTDELLKLLLSAKDIPALKKYTDELDHAALSVTFPEYLNRQLLIRHMSAAELISAAQIQRNYGYQILDGRRTPSRDKVIALCLALHLDIPGTHRALILTGHGELYAKNRRDSILIFALEKKLSVQETNELLHDMGEGILA